MKVGSFYFNPIAALSFIAGGGFTVFFAAGGPKWAMVGAGIAAFCGMLAQSITSQRAPASSINKDAPIVDPGSGKQIGDQTVACKQDAAAGKATVRAAD